MKCPHCGRDVTVEGASFCPYCSKSLFLDTIVTEKKKLFPKIAGISAILGSVLMLSITIVYLATMSEFLGSPFSAHARWFGNSSLLLCYCYYLTMVIVGVISSIFGVAGGVFALKKRRKEFSIFGVSFLAASGVALFLGANPTYFVNALSFTGISTVHAYKTWLQFSPIISLGFMIPIFAILSLILIYRTRYENYSVNS